MAGCLFVVEPNRIFLYRIVVVRGGIQDGMVAASRRRHAVFPSVPVETEACDASY